MESTHTAALNISELNNYASIAHVFPGMANHSLLSVGQLFNEGYTVTFRNESVTICNSQELQILRDARDLEIDFDGSTYAKNINNHNWP
jgi:hypothetical protein